MKLGMALPWVLSTPSSGGRSVSLRDQLAFTSLSCASASGPVRRSPGHRASQTYSPAARWKSLQLRPPIAHAESRLQLPTCRLRKKLFAVAAESALAIRHGVFAVPNFFLPFTHPLTHAKWRQRADIAIPFQVSLTSTHLHEKARCAQGADWITPVKTPVRHRRLSSHAKSPLKLYSSAADSPLEEQQGSTLHISNVVLQCPSR